MSAQQRMKVANEKASKNITQRGNVIKPVSTISNSITKIFNIFVENCTTRDMYIQVYFAVRHLLVTKGQ